MKRTTSITLAILVVALVAVPLGSAGVLSSGGAQEDTGADGGNESIEPGEQFSATVGVQKAEIDGDVSERALGIEITNAETSEAKAAAIADAHEEQRNRLGELEARLEALNESREADEIGEGRYRGDVTRIVAETRSLERQAAIAETAAADVPEDALDDRGVDVDAIRTLRERASELGGAENAEIARSIAGEDVGRPFGDRTPGSPPDVPVDAPSGDRGGDGTTETANASSAD